MCRSPAESGVFGVLEAVQVLLPGLPAVAADSAQGAPERRRLPHVLARGRSSRRVVTDRPWHGPTQPPLTNHRLSSWWRHHRDGIFLSHCNASKYWQSHWSDRIFPMRWLTKILSYYIVLLILSCKIYQNFTFMMENNQIGIEVSSVDYLKSFSFLEKFRTVSFYSRWEVFLHVAAKWCRISKARRSSVSGQDARLNEVTEFPKMFAVESKLHFSTLIVADTCFPQLESGNESFRNPAPHDLQIQNSD